MIKIFNFSGDLDGATNVTCMQVEAFVDNEHIIKK